MKIKNPKKSLGQNFLTDKNIIDIIVNKGDIKQNDIILEIGPGTGNLTERILFQKPLKLFAIEKDKILANKLREKFNKKINLINDDILNLDEKIFSYDSIVVFGNLPYNISTKILSSLILLKKWPPWYHTLILMFQPLHQSQALGLNLFHHLLYRVRMLMNHFRKLPIQRCLASLLGFHLFHH